MKVFFVGVSVPNDLAALALRGVTHPAGLTGCIRIPRILSFLTWTPPHAHAHMPGLPRAQAGRQRMDGWMTNFQLNVCHPLPLTPEMSDKCQPILFLLQPPSHLNRMLMHLLPRARVPSEPDEEGTWRGGNEGKKGGRGVIRQRRERGG